MREPPEPGNGTSQFRNIPWRAESERRAHDPFRMGVQEVPEPPPPERRRFPLIGVFVLVLLVAAVSAYVGMTFVASARPANAATGASPADPGTPIIRSDHTLGRGGGGSRRANSGTAPR